MSHLIEDGDHASHMSDGEHGIEHLALLLVMLAYSKP